MSMVKKGCLFLVTTAALLPLACGVPTVKQSSSSELHVFKGKGDNENAFTSLVKIRSTLGGRNVLVCSGVVVQPDIILTAAHCFSSGGQPLRKDQVLSGFFIEGFDNRTAKIAAYVASEYKFSVIDKHPQTTQGMDLAVVRTKTALGLPPAILPFELNQESKNALANRLQDTNATTTLQLAGYGMDNYSFEKYELGDLKSGAVKFRRFTSEFKDFHYGDMERMACQGDSGGGIFVDHVEQRYLLGIHSRPFTPNTDEPCGFSDGSLAANLLNRGHMEFFLQALENLPDTNPPSPEDQGIFPVPGRIEAEDYKAATDTTPTNTGNAQHTPPFRVSDYGVDLYSSGTGKVVGSTKKGESLRYLFRVSEQGNYDLDVAASRDYDWTWEKGNIAATIIKDGQTIKQLKVTNIQTEGWDSYKVYRAGKVDLEPGDYELMIKFEDSANLDYFTVLKN